jgi:hypothetical protein
MHIRLKQTISFALAMVLAIVQCGCSAFAGSRQRFSVTASEDDARIYVNGNMLGTGSVQTSVPRDQSVSVMAKKDGYHPVTREVGTQMSFLGILDMIGGCCFLLPFIGLAFPGSHELDQNNVSLVLHPATK